jgi:hypothetical protein
VTIVIAVAIALPPAATLCHPHLLKNIMQLLLEVFVVFKIMFIIIFLTHTCMHAHRHTKIALL